MNPDYLIMLLLAIFVFLAYLIGRKIGQRVKEGEVEREREDAIRRSRAVLSGQFSEQLAPYLPDFPYKPTEARFIGKPIDFIGMDEKDISDVVFVEVKSGSSTLSTHERRLRDVIKKGNVKWEQYDIPKKMTD